MTMRSLLSLFEQYVKMIARFRRAALHAFRNRRRQPPCRHGGGASAIRLADKQKLLEPTRLGALEMLIGFRRWRDRCAARSRSHPVA